MRATVCELPDEPRRFPAAWEALGAHVRSAGSGLVLLPEMCFAPWFAAAQPFDRAAWEGAVAAHEAWLSRLPELAPAAVLGTRPVERGGRRLNEGFLWHPETGYRAVHTKAYLPDEDGVWEASWFDRGDGGFTPVDGAGARIGFAICTELWAMEHMAGYRRAGVHLLAVPRATGKASLDKWLAGTRTAAVVTGAFALSSNRVSDELDFGGRGWILGPDGELLAETSPDRPAVTAGIDLGRAEAAKGTFPRYALDRRPVPPPV